MAVSLLEMATLGVREVCKIKTGIPKRSVPGLHSHASLRHIPAGTLLQYLLNFIENMH
jgi:hypothetical protein